MVLDVQKVTWQQRRPSTSEPRHSQLREFRCPLATICSGRTTLVSNCSPEPSRTTSETANPAVENQKPMAVLPFQNADFVFA
jgi:hypothetical protein